MNLNIITVARKGEYLHKTLETLECSDWKYSNIPIGLLMGSEDEGYVERYRSDSRITIVPWVGEKPQIHVAFVLNYIRALQHNTLGTGLCVFEDDIAFTKNWLARTLFAIQEMECKSNLSHYILSLYTARDLSGSSFNRGKWYRSYLANWFFGTQGCYFPKIVQEELAMYLEDNQDRKPGDLLLSEWCYHHQNLYNTSGSIVDHMGAISTGLGGHHHPWNLLD